MALTVKQLIGILAMLPEQDAPITILSSDGVEELPFVDDGPIVTMEGGGASPRFAAINVVVAP